MIKKIFFLLLFVYGYSNADTMIDKSMAVSFSVKEGTFSLGEISVLTDVVSSKINNYNGISVFPKEKVNKAMDSLKIDRMTGSFSPDTLTNLGKIIGVNYIYSFHIEPNSNGFTIDAQIINTVFGNKIGSSHSVVKCSKTELALTEVPNIALKTLKSVHFGKQLNSATSVSRLSNKKVPSNVDNNTITKSNITTQSKNSGNLTRKKTTESKRYINPVAVILPVVAVAGIATIIVYLATKEDSVDNADSQTELESPNPPVRNRAFLNKVFDY